MKTLFACAFLLFSLPSFASDAGVVGQVFSVQGCADKVMVWVSLDKENYKERLLLMHTTVPVGGKFQFYLRPGTYQVRASDEKGCEYFRRVKVSEALSSLSVRMVKK